MIKQGLTREWVVGQLQKYQAAATRPAAAKNVQLAPRTDLMKKILEYWPKQ
jgi:hypothetical protein